MVQQEVWLPLSDIFDEHLEVSSSLYITAVDVQNTFAMQDASETLYYHES